MSHEHHTVTLTPPNNYISNNDTVKLQKENVVFLLILIFYSKHKNDGLFKRSCMMLVGSYF